MKRRILAYKVTREKIIKALEDIKWEVYRWQNDHFVYLMTPRGEKISWCLMGDRIETTQDHNFCFSCCFYYKDCYLEKLEDETLSLVSKNSPTKSVFILFHNFDLKKEVK